MAKTIKYTPEEFIEKYDTFGLEYNTVKHVLVTGDKEMLL
jgi:hypothetical protein